VTSQPQVASEQRGAAIPVGTITPSSPRWRFCFSNRNGAGEPTRCRRFPRCGISSARCWRHCPLSNARNG